jgi:2-formylbenzoate dehydrogenase
MPDIRDSIAARHWQLTGATGPAEAATGRHYEVIDPSTGEPLATAPDCDARDVARAYEAGVEAAAAWRRVVPRERGHLLRRLADVLDAHREELAGLDAADLGSPITEMRLDVGRGTDALRLFADFGLRLGGEVIPATREHLHYTRREPYGVVGRIIPFNHPFMFAASRIAAPLMAGNAVILKPAHQTPLSALRLGELAHHVLPPGLLAVLTGAGPATGDALVRHPGIRRIAFIGSAPVGLAIQRAAAETAVKHITLELGGKNAVIVMPDAPLEAAADSIVRGMNVTASTGQSCGSGTRLLAHESVADAVGAAVRTRLAALRIGDPLDENTQVGPVVSATQRETIERYVRGARDAGAAVWTPGAVLPPRGFFVEPAVLTDVDHSFAAVREEIFGPVLSVIPFSSETEAVMLANHLDVGLTTSIWTEHLATAHRLAHAVNAGYVWVNGSSAHFPGVPYGGNDDSGVGREESLEEMLSFTRTKAVTVMHVLAEPAPD